MDLALQGVFEGVFSNRHVAIRVGAWAWQFFAAVWGALSWHKLLTIRISARLVLKVSGEVVLLDGW